eukprot:scaffold4211_cov309-Prasinococcus_capsulatus_cf.AAC.2
MPRPAQWRARAPRSDAWGQPVEYILLTHTRPECRAGRGGRALAAMGGAGLLGRVRGLVRVAEPDAAVGVVQGDVELGQHLVAQHAHGPLAQVQARVRRQRKDGAALLEALAAELDPVHRGRHGLHTPLGPHAPEVDVPHARRGQRELLDGARVEHEVHAPGPGVHEEEGAVLGALLEAHLHVRHARDHAERVPQQALRVRQPQLVHLPGLEDADPAVPAVPARDARVIARRDLDHGPAEDVEADDAGHLVALHDAEPVGAHLHEERLLEQQGAQLEVLRLPEVGLHAAPHAGHVQLAEGLQPQRVGRLLGDHHAARPGVQQELAPLPAVDGGPHQQVAPGRPPRLDVGRHVGQKPHVALLRLQGVRGGPGERHRARADAAAPVQPLERVRVARDGLADRVLADPDAVQERRRPPHRRRRRPAVEHPLLHPAVGEHDQLQGAPVRAEGHAGLDPPPHEPHVQAPQHPRRGVHLDLQLGVGRRRADLEQPGDRGQQPHARADPGGQQQHLAVVQLQGVGHAALVHLPRVQVLGQLHVLPLAAAARAARAAAAAAEAHAARGVVAPAAGELGPREALREAAVAAADELPPGGHAEEVRLAVDAHEEVVLLEGAQRLRAQPYPRPR